MADMHPVLFHGIHTDEVARWIISEFDNGDTLLGTDGVSDTVWLENYTVKPLPAADVAMSLVGPLNEVRVAHIVNCETRSGPLTQLVENWTLSDQDLATLMAGKGFTKSIAAKLYAKPNITDPDVKHRCAHRAGGKSLLDWYAYGTTVDYDEILAAMSDMTASFGTAKLKQSKDELHAILHRYPQLVCDLAAAETVDPRIHTQLAGSRHLTDVALQLRLGANNPEFGDYDTWAWRMLTLVNNPVVGDEVFDMVLAVVDENAGAYSEATYKVKESISRRRGQGQARVTDTYETVDNPATLGWLVNRVRPFDNGYGPGKPGRPWDAAALAHNPHLNDEQADRLAPALDTPFALDQLGDTWLPAAQALLAAHADGPALRALAVTVTEVTDPRPYIPPTPYNGPIQEIPTDRAILDSSVSMIGGTRARRYVELAYAEFGNDLVKWNAFNTFLFELANQPARDVLAIAKRLA